MFSSSVASLCQQGCDFFFALGFPQPDKLIMCFALTVRIPGFRPFQSGLFYCPRIHTAPPFSVNSVYIRRPARRWIFSCRSAPWDCRRATRSSFSFILTLGFVDFKRIRVKSNKSSAVFGCFVKTKNFYVTV